MKKPDGHPDFPVWKLERYLLGELPIAEMERIRTRAEADPAVMEWIRALEAEHRDLAEMHPTGRVAGRIWNRLRADSSAPGKAGFTPRIWVPAFALLLLAFLLPWDHLDGPKPPPPSPELEDARMKGLRPALYLYRKTDTGVEALSDRERVRPGELIQVFYDAAGRGQGAIFSLDHNGHVTWHLPDAGAHSVPMAPGGKIPLGFAFELDSLAGYERFYFVAADRPFDLGPVLAQVAPLRSSRGPDRLPLDSGFTQHSIVLIKDSGI